MLAHSDIQRSIGKISIDLNRQMEARRTRADLYRLGEQEWQAQYEFYGDVGSLPVETTITIPFGITFVADAGLARDSTLDRPLARFSAEMLVTAPGFVPYHYLQSWTFDDDRNYVGAVILVGMHCPAFLIAPPPTTAFRFILHAGFQGYGAIWDPDGAFDSGGTIDDTGS